MADFFVLSKLKRCMGLIKSMMLKYINSNKAKVVLVILLGLLATQVKAQQQSFTYTQYMDNLTPLNPAYSLIDKAASVTTMARKQWVGIDGAPTTFLINGNIPLESINASAGLIVLNDQFAVEHQTEVNAYFAKSIQLGEKDFLAVSLNAGIRNYVANYSTLDSTDPAFANDIRQTKPNVGFGVMYYSDTFYIGVSVPELTITNLGTASVQSSNNFKNHYYFSSALITDLSEDIKFKPSTLLSYQKGVPLIADFSGIIYLKETLGLGISYRTNSEVAGIITVNVEGFHVGYSYQFGSSSNNLGGFNIPTHEVNLSYRFGKGAAHPKLL
jgi:type IX secretion system PorP/SprF family membrane protein